MRFVSVSGPVNIRSERGRKEHGENRRGRETFGVRVLSCGGEGTVSSLEKDGKSGSGLEVRGCRFRCLVWLGEWWEALGRQGDGR